MELPPQERAHSPRVVALRQRIAGVLDRYSDATALKKHTVESFFTLMQSVQSEKLKLLREKNLSRLDTRATRLARTAGALDIVFGTAMTVGGIEGIITALRRMPNIRKKYEFYQDKVRPKAIQGIVGSTLGPAWIFSRPISRSMDVMMRLSLPLNKRIVSVVDTILLRREQKSTIQHVFVGSAKA